VPQSYQGAHFQFLYPDGWTIEENPSQGGVTVNLQSPYSMFVFLRYFDQGVVAQELADEALASMAEEYPELDSDTAMETIAGTPATGHDVSFFSLDLTNTCWIRALSFANHALLVFGQISDLDLDRGELAFRGICASLKLGRSGPSSSAG